MTVVARFLDPTRLHVSAAGGVLNDQVGFILVARNLVETGRLHSNLIYPSTLSQNKSRTYLYMPGYYVALATSYAIFGFGVYQSLLPSAAAFVLGALLVFLMATRLYDRRTGFVAAVLFMGFPANLLFSLTAMSESAFVAATLVAVAAFVFVPKKWRPYAGPLLLVLPFLFRETAVFLVVPLSALVLRDRTVWQPRAAVVILVGTLALLSVVFRLDFSAGRPGLNTLHFDEATILGKYSDATIPPLPPTLSAWVQAVATNVLRNRPRLIGLLSNPTQVEGLAFDTVLILGLVVLTYGFVVCRRDLFPLACGLMMVFVMAAVLLIYSPNGFRGVRMLLFTYPLLAVCGARLATQFDVVRWFPRYRRAVGAAACLGLGTWLWVSVGTIAAIGRTLPASDAMDDAALAFMNSVRHEDRGMLVAPFWVALPYVLVHHPVQWAFVPMNRQTLELLSQQYDIETVVMPGDGYGTNVRFEDLQTVGLTLERRLEYQRVPYLVFKRAGSSGGGGAAARSREAPMQADVDDR